MEQIQRFDGSSVTVFAIRRDRVTDVVVSRGGHHAGGAVSMVAVSQAIVRIDGKVDRSLPAHRYRARPEGHHRNLNKANYPPFLRDLVERWFAISGFILET